MTSEERRKGRRERREAERKKKHEDYIRKYNDFNLVLDLDNLKAAYRKSRRGVAWKESVQRYDLFLMSNLAETKQKLARGESISKGFVEFDIHERGKMRHIRSVHISERVVQKCLCDNVLTPLMTRSLIYDNGASIKNKGIHFAMNRLRCHLSRFYRENGNNNGYALVIDFSKYFDNILHEKVFEMQKKNITDERIFELYKSFVTVFGDGISLGLGSQVSQISAISYPNKLDHYCKEVLRVRYYGRYMDDTYLIHKDKKHLEYCLTEIKRICDELGIKLNPKKTCIVPLDEGFWFLKGKYILLPSGKIVCKAKRDGIIRMKRKLKSFKKKYDLGLMPKEDVYTSYQSFRSHLLHFDSYYLVKNMDNFYKGLFHEENITGVVIMKDATKNVYLAIKGDVVIHHTDLSAMKTMDGISVPGMTITEEEFEAAGGLVRLIDGKIFLGKTDAEKASEEAIEKIRELKMQLAETDYIASKIAEGSATTKDYADKIAERQEWRAEINRLEKLVI